MDSIKVDLAKLNTTGCEYLVSGEFSSAIEHFTEALRLVRVALKGDIVPKVSCSTTSSSTTSYSTPLTTTTTTPTTTTPTSCSDERDVRMEDDWEEEEEEEEEDLFFDLSSLNLHDGETLYSRPIITPTDRHSDVSFYSLHDYSFFILFNLALAHHLDALGKVSSSVTPESAVATASTRGQLESALSLYELAYSLQVRDDCSVNVLHGCALLNNIGHIQRRLHHEERATKCFQHLLSMLMVIVGSGDGVVDDNYDVCESVIAPFFHTVQRYILQRSCSAPAA